MAESSQFLETIRSSTIQDFIIDVRGYAGEMTIVVNPEKLHEVIDVLKNQFHFNYLSDITATDHYTEEKRFEVSYNLANLDGHQRLRVAVLLEEDKPEVASISDLYSAADWREREEYDMMGINFVGHPDLRRMFMPEDFEFFPLRKEFPLLGIPGTIQFPEKDPPKDYK